jgi:uncharacterized protein
VSELLELLDWKRRVFELYRDVRAQAEPEVAWKHWIHTRDEMFATHPQSPLHGPARQQFEGLHYFPYDAHARVAARVAPAEQETYEVPTSQGTSFSFTRFAVAEFRLRGVDLQLELYWLQGYGGGVFVPFRDATAGQETYGGGRYLLDTVKGSDLGGDPDALIFDFNFAYNPSCSYDPRWVCPLAPPPNRLEVEVRAGERHVH